MKTRLYTILIVFFTLAFTSCQDELLEEKPPHLISTESLYTNYAGFETGINGLYATIRGERAGYRSLYDGNFPRTDVFMMGTDNMAPNHYGSQFAALTMNWAINNTSHEANLESFFVWLYEIINAANTIINQAEDKADVDWSGGGSTGEENKNKVIAEAKAIRAWAYRHLTYCWGDVPLSLEESLGSNIKTDWERTPVNEVRRQMMSDWLFAEEHLEVEPSVAGKISKGAVQHYIAELYLVFDKPDSALYWANQCINTPEYELITERYGVKSDQPGVPFMDMFYEGNSNREEGNSEALWVWQFGFEITGGARSCMRRWVSTTNYLSSNLQYTYERGGRGIGRIGMTRWALNLYEDQDDRGSNFAIRKYFILKTAEQNAPAPADIPPPGKTFGDTIWMNSTDDLVGQPRRPDWPYPRKYDSTPITNLTTAFQYNDQVYLRLAETYLIKAEAQYKLGDAAGAAETINVVRRRSNASEISASDVDIDFILDERSRELVAEEHRRYTLLRTGRWLERVRMYNNNGGSTASARDTLFPIPQLVIDANLTSEFPQNPGFN